MAATNPIPISYLRACLKYAPSTGVLTWRSRPPEHFATADPAAYLAAKAEQHSFQPAPRGDA
jgi:hypothetical protein